MSREPRAPLHTDPVHHAPTDPTLVAAPDGSWRMFYTQRRAGDDGPGVRWVHGTDIGVAASDDGGLTWAADSPDLTDVHVAALRVTDGHLTCDRDGPTDLDLRRARTA